MRYFFVRAMHFLAKRGHFGGVRTAPFKLARLYCSRAAMLVNKKTLEEGLEDIDWNSFRSKLESLVLPNGTRKDHFPKHHGWRKDEVGIHHDALVFGIHPTAFSRSGHICSSLRHSDIWPFVKGQLRTSDLVMYENWLLGREVKAVQIEKAVILDNGMGHFGHWLFEQLPQLRLLEMHKDCHVIYNGTDSWKRRLLLDFGWPEHLLLPYVTGDEIFQVEELVMTNGGRLNGKDLGWLRNTAIGLYGGLAETQMPRKIYVSRQGVGNRHVSNFEQIVPILNEFDIAVVLPEKLGIEKSVQIFQNAEFIIGPEGSGMRNMVWSKKAKVVEIYGHEVNFGQWSMAHALGFDYAPYLEERSVPKTKARWRDLDVDGVHVSPDSFRAFLSRHLNE